MIELIQSGDRQAFNELVIKYQQKIINTSFAMLSDYEDACDAAQEVFVKVYRSINSFRGDSSLSTWIYRITKNVCSDFLRKRRESTLSIDNDDTALQVSDDSYLPDKTTERNEVHKLLMKAISELDENSRIVLVLYEMDDLSYDEISEVLNLPIGTVKSRLKRAREKLKNILSPNRELFL